MAEPDSVSFVIHVDNFSTPVCAEKWPSSVRTPLRADDGSLTSRVLSHRVRRWGRRSQRQAGRSSGPTMAAAVRSACCLPALCGVPAGKCWDPDCKPARAWCFPSGLRNSGSRDSCRGRAPGPGLPLGSGRLCDLARLLSFSGSRGLRS